MSRAARLLLVVLGALLAPVLATVPPATAAEPSSAGQKGFAEIAGCISSADNVLVSIVVDESLSLRDTDPDDLRVRGITTAIDSLEQLAASVEDSTRVHVSLSAFARGYETLVGWQRLGEATGEELRSTVERTLPDRDTGDATDYRQALLGAQRDLDSQQRRLGDADACKVMLWFTDGALDVDGNTDTAGTQLCQVGGILDAVRSDDIAVVALALFTPGADVTQAQREQLRAVAEGEGEQVTCGKVPLPSGSAQGVYLPAGDPAALQQLFAGAGALVGGGTHVGTISCPGPQCRNGIHPLTIDRGIAGARVLVSTDSAAGALTLTAPSGRKVRLADDQRVEVDGATVEYFAREQLATLDISYPDHSQDRDRWLIEPADPSELAVYWFWGAGLQLETTALQAGETTEVRLQLVDQDGDPLDPGLYDAVRADVRAGDREIPSRLTDDGALVAPLELGVDGLPTTLPLTVSVRAGSSPSRIPLGPVTLTERLPVELPPAYPSVSPTELDLGALEGLGTASGELTVRGSELGRTRVCLVGSSVALPGDAAADTQVTAEQKCVDVARGGSAPLALAYSPPTSVDGVATGEVSLSMEPADGSEPLEVTVPVRLDMERQVDESTRWVLITVLVALAVLLPLVLLVLTNRWLGRFAMTAGSRTATKRVRITPGGLQPLTGSSLVEPADLENAGFSGRRSNGRLPVEGTGITLQARRILSLREPQGVAVGPAEHLLVSGRTPHRGDRSEEAPAGLGDVDATFVVIDPGGTPEEAEGTLVLVVPESVSYEGIQRRAQLLSTEPDWSKHLAEAAELREEPALATAGSAATRSPRSAPSHTAGASSTSGAADGSSTERFEQPERYPWETAPPPDDDDGSSPPLPDFLR